MTDRKTDRVPVVIVGAGPAGLMLSHLLHLAGIRSTVLEARGRDAIEATIRAGVLEQNTVDLMVETGLGDRMLREGHVHEGFEFRFSGESRRIDLKALTGRSITVYPQHEVLKDLINARLSADGDLRFEVKDVQVRDVETAPRVSFTDAAGIAHEIEAEFVAGCDGFYGACRHAIPSGTRRDYQRIYPFGWFGILAEAPPSAPELVYARHERGFALISTRSPGVQRMYFQCDPAEPVEDWSQARIWEELQTRVSGSGFRLNEGPVFQKNVIAMRSFVCEPMRHGRLFLAGDAAHIVPPTGAKGLNLAVADVWVLARALERFFRSGTHEGLDAYSETALRRVWRAQHFSWWMTSMLHRFEGATEFDHRRQLAELDMVTRQEAASRTVAENYAGLPLGAFGG